MTEEATRGVHIERDFRLAGGQVLAEACAAYITLGTLNVARDNAVLITHGFTSSHEFVLSGSSAAEGSWSELVGPGKAIDTRRYFVVSSNALGSCYGSTGPASIDPATGEPYGPDFPAISFEDIVRLQKSMLVAMGVRKLHAVAGVSMGGFQALQWGVQYPQSVSRLVIALAHLDGRGASAGAQGLRDAFAADPNWHSGRYAPGDMGELLSRLRLDTLRRYGMDAWLASLSLDEPQRSERMCALSRAWAEGFDANSLATLIQTIERFDVREQLGAIRARVLYVLSSSDALFPSSLGPAAMQDLKRHGVQAHFHELRSDYGHLASGIDAHLWSEVLREFLTGQEQVDAIQTFAHETRRYG
ncbi:alpha/beta fold hydrolase [Variovorax sp. ZS18.2.2]|uniref:alpha/beta fold hydrolase n=1 Tax=Variovorax sp. ZS18.2.2 TaxID=2971255 RepID=UPI002151C9BB|nr:alpha/beta fold hydrolase [Variovorax sp. ZS18.2.2]MCR6475963.1 alpha/beta fold hydrolase [Variovorax sp. ZS18.2.2]